MSKNNHIENESTESSALIDALLGAIQPHLLIEYFTGKVELVNRALGHQPLDNIPQILQTRLETTPTTERVKFLEQLIKIAFTPEELALATKNIQLEAGIDPFAEVYENNPDFLPLDTSQEDMYKVLDPECTFYSYLNFIQVGNKQFELSPLPAMTLKLLFDASGKPISKARIERIISQNNLDECVAEGGNNIEVLIARTREKLEYVQKEIIALAKQKAAKNQDLDSYKGGRIFAIVTRRGAGYALVGMTIGKFEELQSKREEFREKIKRSK